MPPTETVPVWMWLPGSTTPVEAGVFTWTAPKGPGRFKYSDEYRAQKAALAIDPIQMTMASPNGVVAVKQKGMFGALRDAGPDAWGEGLLKKRLKLAELTPLQLLTHAGINGSGRVATGELYASREQKILTLQRALEAADAWSRSEAPQNEDPDFDEFLVAIAPTPTLGGAKPKIEVVLDEEQWIAKFPDKGDSSESSVAEAAALSLARMCGIETPDHRVVTFGSGERRKIALLTRRFDRRKCEGGFERYGYASAMTVMHLDTAIDPAPQCSYFAFAHQARLWATRGAGDKQHGDQQAREIWRRIVFTGLIGNRDDHPRNHALIEEKGLWRLSPIFDVVPVEYEPRQRATVMPFLPKVEDGNLISHERLIEASPHFKWNREAAEVELSRMAKIVASGWEAQFQKHGASQALVKARSGAFQFAHEIAALSSSQLLNEDDGTALAAKP